MFCNKFKKDTEEASKFDCNIPGECNEDCIFYEKEKNKMEELNRLSEDNQENYDDKLVEDMKNRTTKIVGVRYESRTKKGLFEGREYSYFTQLENPKFGDIVECPTKFGPQVGMITRLDIPEKEVEKIKDFMKDILIKYNKEAYFQGKIEPEEVIRYGTKG